MGDPPPCWLGDPGIWPPEVSMFGGGTEPGPAFIIFLYFDRRFWNQILTWKEKGEKAFLSPFIVGEKKRFWRQKCEQAKNVEMFSSAGCTHSR
jgi:hypothetical protein